jgi:hypothetical protein
MQAVNMPSSRTLLGSLTFATLVYAAISFYGKMKNMEDDETEDTMHKIYANKLYISLGLGAIVFMLNTYLTDTVTTEIVEVSPPASNPSEI